MMRARQNRRVPARSCQNTSDRRSTSERMAAGVAGASKDSLETFKPMCSNLTRGDSDEQLLNTFSL